MPIERPKHPNVSRKHQHTAPALHLVCDPVQGASRADSFVIDRRHCEDSVCVVMQMTDFGYRQTPTGAEPVAHMGNRPPTVLEGPSTGDLQLQPQDTNPGVLIRSEK
jgi:hypothetical protein